MTPQGPSEPPAIVRETRRVRVLFGGHEIADSADVLVIEEHGQGAVRYFPKDDVEMSVLGRASTQTLSATLGMATYYTLVRDAHVIEDAIYSYETPPPAFAAIAGRLAFLPSEFEFDVVG